MFIIKNLIAIFLFQVFINMNGNEDCKELLEEIIQLDIIDETKLKEVYLKTNGWSDLNLLQKMIHLQMFKALENDSSEIRNRFRTSSIDESSTLNGWSPIYAEETK